MTCKPWDVVVVPFPFSERPGAKRRPALVISEGKFNRHGHTILAMITSHGHTPWPGDTVIGDHAAAGLSGASVVRLKLFTLDNRLFLRVIGRLTAGDRSSVRGVLEEFVA